VKYVLDTNVVIAALKGHPGVLAMFYPTWKSHDRFMEPLALGKIGAVHGADSYDADFSRL
jgi:hypothetical protein